MSDQNYFWLEVPDSSWAGRDIISVSGIEVPRLTVEGTRFLIINFPHFGGSLDTEQSRYLAHLSHHNGWRYVTCAWPGVECGDRKIENMSTVQSFAQAEALFEQAAQEVAGDTRIIIIGSSLSTTPALRMGKKHADLVDHVFLLSPGYDIIKHMIIPLLKENYEQWHARPGQVYLQHPFYVPFHKPVGKFGYISREDLDTVRKFQLFDDGATLENMPPVTIIAGEKDAQIPFSEAQKLCSLIRIREGEKTEAPKLIGIEHGKHLLIKPEELELLGGAMISAMRQSLDRYQPCTQQAKL